jgi:hypothetical protein
MSYMGLDPAGPFEKCPICGEPMDYTKSQDHRECIPKVQVIGWYICKTCGRWPWDCRCWTSAVCIECDQSVEDIHGPICPDSPDGYHCWRVPDGDGFRLLTPRVSLRPPRSVSCAKCGNIDAWSFNGEGRKCLECGNKW